MKDRDLIFEKSRPGKVGYSLPELDVPQKDNILPDNLKRKEPAPLPEVAEGEVIRHYINLSQLNHSVDNGFYPLGSCTMKYNPKINEDISRLPGFAGLHPYQSEDMTQGALKIMAELEKYLCEIGGMDRVTLQPAAGAHGELTGLMLMRAYHKHRGQEQRKKIIIPDSGHGTNPASVTMCGYETVEIPSDDKGCIDLEALKEVLDDKVAGIMLTNPNTLGFYEENVSEVCRLVHEAGGLLYYDGANANAIMGYSRPGDMGFDIIHFNLHKTFGTPHGGGGPGSGPVGVKDKLVPFLPNPMVEEEDGKYFFDYDRPQSIGRVRSFYGNFGVLLKAFTYIRMMGARGLKQVSEDAVLNANYIMEKLSKSYYLKYHRNCMHEFVLSGKKQKDEHGVTTTDIVKNLLDHGIHPPTVYFPLIVEEAMMIEPTETESKETLDNFIEVMEKIAKMAEEDPEKLKEAPFTTPVRRLDEASAARNPILKWEPEE